jgi:hypothetical protein
MSQTEGGVFCKYKDIFGKPSEGAHSWRVFGFAGVDVFATAFVAVLLSLVVGGVISNFIVLIVLGIIMHHFFCVETKLNTMLGL